MSWIVEYKQNGYYSHKNSVNSLVLKIQERIAQIFDTKIEELDKSALAENLNQRIRTNPELRNEFYQELQQIPDLQELPKTGVVQKILENLSFQEAKLCELKTQIYFPWEACFFQGWHQDINTFGKTKSVTMWVPITISQHKSAVKFLSGSHLLGPVVHQAHEDPIKGIWHAQLPNQESYLTKKVESLESLPGDIVCLNRLVHHTSPKQEEQNSLRLIVVMRFDSNNPEHQYTKVLAKETYSPYSMEYYQTNIIPQVRNYLLKAPPVWSAPIRI